MQFRSLCNHDQAGFGDGKSLGIGLSVVPDFRVRRDEDIFVYDGPSDPALCADDDVFHDNRFM